MSQDIGNTVAFGWVLELVTGFNDALVFGACWWPGIFEDDLSTVVAKMMRSWSQSAITMRLAMIFVTANNVPA